MSLRRNQSINRHCVFQILIHLLLYYHYDLCALTEFCEVRRPRTCTLSLPEGASTSHFLEEPLARPIVQVRPENQNLPSAERQGSQEISEEGWGMTESERDEFTKFSKDIPGIRLTDPKYPTLIREIANTIFSPRALWGSQLKRMCERFYTQGIRVDPHEQVALLKALDRLTEYKMPFQAVQIALGALAKIELFLTEGYVNIWGVEHEKIQRKLVKLMLKFIDAYYPTDGRDQYAEYAEFRRNQADLGDYGVRLKVTDQYYEKDLFKFWISHMKIYSIYSKSEDAIQEIVEIQLILIKKINPSNNTTKLQKNIAGSVRNDPVVGYLKTRFVENLKSLQAENIRNFLSIQNVFERYGLKIIGESYSLIDKQKILEFWVRHMMIYCTIKNFKYQRALLLGVEGLVLRDLDQTSSLMKDYCEHMYSQGFDSNIIRGFLEFCSKKSRDRFLRTYAREAVEEFDNRNYCYGLIPSLDSCRIT